MRLAQYLKTCCLVKRRSEAKRACDNGIVVVEGATAKASQDVKTGDYIAIAFTDRYLDIEVLDLPRSNVSKAQAKDYYRIERDEARDPLDF